MASLLPPHIIQTGLRLVEALRAEAANYLPVAKQPDIRLDTAAFREVIDPANGLPGYEGVWRNTLNERIGSLIFNSDGSFYAEFDLVCRHPRDARWFVESVTVWGSGEVMRSEPRLIPMV